MVFTIGPACQDVDTLCKILETGATVARVDVAVCNKFKFHISNLKLNKICHIYAYIK